MQTTSNNIKWHSKPPWVGAAVRVVAVGATSVLVVGTTLRVLVAVWLSTRADLRRPGPAAADELIVFGAASLALAIAAWLVLATVLELLAHLPGRIGAASQVCSARLTPALARRVAAFVLGVGVGVAVGPAQALAGPRTSPSSGPGPTTSSLASPAVSPAVDPGFVPGSGAFEAPPPGFLPAATPDPPSPVLTTAAPSPGSIPAPPSPAFTTAVPSPGFTPAAPRVRPQPDPGLLGGRPTPATDSEVVVHRGDSLWSIAARHLGSRASDAEIAHAWPQWFHLNRDVIGNDPDVILPGQVLRIPDDHAAGVTP